MMRTESAARAKGNRNVPHLVPEEGSKLRALYDQFMANKAEPIVPKFIRDERRSLSDLIDYYGLDIRHHSYRHYWLVGEWFGKTYIDYIAAHREREERKQRS